MSQHTTPSSCRTCGATSYRRVIARNDQGALRPTEMYQCSGCSVVFAEPKAWREGGSDELKLGGGPTSPMRPTAVMAAEARLLVPQAPNPAPYGLCPLLTVKGS